MASLQSPYTAIFPLQGFLVNKGGRNFTGTFQEPFLSLGPRDRPVSSGHHEQEVKQCLQG